MTKIRTKYIPATNTHGAKIISDPEFAYLTWLNDFLTIKRFAEYFQLEIQHAKTLINKGRELNHAK